jgi:phospholipid/cholesterol/gamma-HCH transport system substrate-binding protein
VKLPRDSRATIKSESIMGGKFIEIAPGIQPTMLQNGDSIVGTYEADLTELTATLAPISSNVLGILENVNSTFDNETRRKIKDIVADVNRSTGELDRLVLAEGRRLDSAMERFQTFTTSLTRLATALDTIAVNNRTDIDSSLASIHRTTRNIEVLSRNLKSTSSSLDVVLGKMKNGEGTLGKLVHDESLYNHLDSLSLNMNALAKDLRENPGRYVKLSLF